MSAPFRTTSLFAGRADAMFPYSLPRYVDSETAIGPGKALQIEVSTQTVLNWVFNARPFVCAIAGTLSVDPAVGGNDSAGTVTFASAAPTIGGGGTAAPGIDPLKEVAALNARTGSVASEWVTVCTMDLAEVEDSGVFVPNVAYQMRAVLTWSFAPGPWLTLPQRPHPSHVCEVDLRVDFFGRYTDPSYRAVTGSVPPAPPASWVSLWNLPIEAYFGVFDGARIGEAPPVGTTSATPYSPKFITLVDNSLQETDPPGGTPATSSSLTLLDIWPAESYLARPGL